MHKNESIALFQARHFSLRLLLSVALLSVASLSPDVAHADDDYSKVSVQKLLLRSSVRSSLAANYVSAFYGTIGMKNFIIQDWKLDDAKVKTYSTVRMRQTPRAKRT